MIVFFWKKRGLGEGPLVKNLTQGVTQGFTRGFTKDFTEDFTKDFTKDLSNDFAKDFTKEFNKNLSAQIEGAQAPDASPIFTISGEKQFQNFHLFFVFY